MAESPIKLPLRIVWSRGRVFHRVKNRGPIRTPAQQGEDCTGRNDPTHGPYGYIAWHPFAKKAGAPRKDTPARRSGTVPGRQLFRPTLLQHQQEVGGREQVHAPVAPAPGFRHGNVGEAELLEDGRERPLRLDADDLESFGAGALAGSPLEREGVLGPAEDDEGFFSLSSAVTAPSVPSSSSSRKTTVGWIVKTCSARSVIAPRPLPWPASPDRAPRWRRLPGRRSFPAPARGPRPAVRPRLAARGRRPGLVAPRAALLDQPSAPA